MPKRSLDSKTRELFMHKIGRSYKKLIDVRNKQGLGNLLAINAYNKVLAKFNRKFADTPLKFRLLPFTYNTSIGDLETGVQDYFAVGKVGRFKPNRNHLSGIIPLNEIEINSMETRRYSQNPNPKQIMYGGKNGPENNLWMCYFNFENSLTTKEYIHLACEKMRKHEENYSSHLRTEENKKRWGKIEEDIMKESTMKSNQAIEPFKVRDCWSNSVAYIIPLNKETQDIFEALKILEKTTIENYLSIETFTAVQNHFQK